MGRTSLMSKKYGGKHRLLILFVFGILFTWGVFAIQDDAYALIGGIAPGDDGINTGRGIFNLRYHSSGHSTLVSTRVYSTTVGSRPNNVDIEIAKRGSRECKPSKGDHSNVKDIKVNLKIGGVVKASKRDCRSGFYGTHRVANDKWVLDSNNNRYYATVEVSLSGKGGADSWFDSTDRRTWFQFEIKAPSGYLVSMEPATRITHNPLATGSSYKDSNGMTRASYILEFAQPPCETASSTNTIGIWDPDNFYNKYRLQHALRGSGKWSDVPQITGRSASGVRSYSDGWYTPVQGNNENMELKYKFDPKYKYRVTLRTEPENHVTMQWPFSEVYSKDSCWSVTPETTVNASAASVGDTVIWTHRVKENRNPSKDAASGLTVKSIHEGSSSGWSATGGTLTRDISGITIEAGGNSTWTESYSVRPEDAGKTFCSSVGVTPGSSASADQKRSTRRCVSVNAPPSTDFDLRPDITGVTDGYVGEPRSDVNPGGIVNNVGSGTSSGTKWRLITIKLPLDADMSRNKVEQGGSEPCGYYSSKFVGSNNCEVIGTADNKDFPSGLTSIPEVTHAVGSIDEKTCFGLAVSPYSNATGADWRYSKLVCVYAGKKPKVQVWGGNLSVGKSFGGVLNRDASVQGLISAVKGNSLGSWIEYSILAPGKVSGVASGSALAGTEGSSSSALSDWNRLTYANTDFKTGESYGYYDTRDSSLPDPSGLAEKYGLATGDVAGGTYDIQTLRAGANRVVKLDGSGILTIGGADNTLAKGEWLVVDVPNSDVVIADNVSYTTEGMASTSDLPQLVIRAKNITINGGVTNIDAWLVAGETIKTCDKTDDLTINDCNQPLRVNGPVISKSLVLARTAGENNDPAEVFNLRPDVYLWMYNLANSYTDYRVDSIRELPPRY